MRVQVEGQTLGRRRQQGHFTSLVPRLHHLLLRSMLTQRALLSIFFCSIRLQQGRILSHACRHGRQELEISTRYRSHCGTSGEQWYFAQGITSGGVEARSGCQTWTFHAYSAKDSGGYEANNAFLCLSLVGFRHTHRGFTSCIRTKWDIARL